MYALIRPEKLWMSGAAWAQVRHLPVARVMALIATHTDDRRFDILGERTVDVLGLNLALDAMR